MGRKSGRFRKRERIRLRYALKKFDTERVKQYSKAVNSLRKLRTKLTRDVLPIAQEIVSSIRKRGSQRVSLGEIKELQRQLNKLVSYCK